MESFSHDKSSQEKGKALLSIDQFQLEKRCNALFYSVLCSIIEIYNKGVKEEIEKNNIYLLEKERILLANITENLVEDYYEYKRLFNDLMGGQDVMLHNSDTDFSQINNCYFKTKPKEGGALSAKSYQNKSFPNKSIISISDADKYTNNSYFKNENKSYVDECSTSEKDSKINSKFDKFSSYFNGMFFETVAIESLYKLIDSNINDEESAKKVITFLPRILFYMKKTQTVQPTNKYYGYNEIDCAFIFKEKEQVVFPKEIISCFKDLYINDEYELFNLNNICNITLQKNDVVLLEVKSSFNPSKKEEKEKNKIKSNKILKFVKNAKLFIKFYLKLNLIKPNQRIVLIYLYNNSMYFDLNNEKKNIDEAKALIQYDLNIKLEIAYYQSYMKIINSYQNIRNVRNLNHRLENQEKEIKKQNEEIKKQNEEINKQNEKIKKQEAKHKISDDKIRELELLVKKLMEEKRKEKEALNSHTSEENSNTKNNNDEGKGNEQDNNVKNKKNSITSVAETNAGSSNYE